MNRNFTSFALIIWVVCYIISVSGEQAVGAAKAELAGKIFGVFFWVWLACFGAIVWYELMKYGKKTRNPLEEWR